MRGRMIRLSVPRRIVIDLLYFASGIPTVPVQKRMSLGALVAARAACRERPRWTAIFTKAYALMAREFPLASPLRVPRQQRHRHHRARLPWRGRPVFDLDQRTGTPVAARHRPSARACFDGPGRGDQGFPPHHSIRAPAPPATPGALVDLPEHRPPAWQLLRDIRGFGLFGA